MTNLPRLSDESIIIDSATDLKKFTQKLILTIELMSFTTKIQDFRILMQMQQRNY